MRFTKRMRCISGLSRAILGSASLILPYPRSRAPPFFLLFPNFPYLFGAIIDGIPALSKAQIRSVDRINGRLFFIH